MMSAFRNQELDLLFCYRFLLAFNPQDPVAVVQVKIDPALGKDFLQKEGDMPGSQLILHVGLEEVL